MKKPIFLATCDCAGMIFNVFGADSTGGSGSPNFDDAKRTSSLKAQIEIGLQDSWSHCLHVAWHELMETCMHVMGHSWELAPVIQLRMRNSDRFTFIMNHREFTDVVYNAAAAFAEIEEPLRGAFNEFHKVSNGDKKSKRRGRKAV